MRLPPADFAAGLCSPCPLSLSWLRRRFRCRLIYLWRRRLGLTVSPPRWPARHRGLPPPPQQRGARPPAADGGPGDAGFFVASEADQPRAAASPAGCRRCETEVGPLNPGLRRLIASFRTEAQRRSVSLPHGDKVGEVAAASSTALVFLASISSRRLASSSGDRRGGASRLSRRPPEARWASGRAPDRRSR